jgi:hypothetical protein
MLAVDSEGVPVRRSSGQSRPMEWARFGRRSARSAILLRPLPRLARSREGTPPRAEDKQEQSERPTDNVVAAYFVVSLLSGLNVSCAFTIGFSLKPLLSGSYRGPIVFRSSEPYARSQVRASGVHPSSPPWAVIGFRFARGTSLAQRSRSAAIETFPTMTPAKCRLRSTPSTCTLRGYDEHRASSHSQGGHR